MDDKYSPIRVCVIWIPLGNYSSSQAGQQCSAVKEHMEGVRYQPQTVCVVSDDIILQ